jgi:4-amino-4-deoxy-L-arabinose transferase-like glycosyltransferase
LKPLPIERLNHLLGFPLTQAQGLLIVLLLALVLRLIYLQGWLYWFPAPQTPIYGDAKDYYDNPLAIPLMVLRGPIYSIFLGGIFTAFGKDPWAVRYIQVGLSVLSCIFIYLMARELSNRQVALIAGLFAATYPTLILFTGRILTETLSIFWFWLGLLLLIKGLRTVSGRLLVLSGVVLSLACLTRPTLIPSLPFLVAAIAVALNRMPWKHRIRLIIQFGLSLFLPVVGWNIIAFLIGYLPPSGMRGFSLLMTFIQSATDPSLRGWYPDIPMNIPAGNPDWWKTVIWQNPFYLPAAAFNLIFYHQWFLDNVWRELPIGMHWLQRLLLISALGGIGVSLWQWRKFAPILFLLFPLSIVSIKWIEIRPNLPLIPTLFILAGVFISTVLNWIQSGINITQKRWLLISGLLLTVLILFSSRLFHLATLLPNLHPLMLGRISDGVIVFLSLLWGGIFAWMAYSSRWLLRNALITGFVPALLFAILFSSYTWVASEPRWRSWTIDMSQLQRPIEQEIYLSDLIDADQFDTALWLVDIQTSMGPPALKIRMNGVESPESTWKSLFCTLEQHNTWSESEKIFCPIYRDGLASFIGSLDRWPQWWGIPVKKNSITSRSKLSLILTPEIVDDREAKPEINLGGTFSQMQHNQFYGPSVQAQTVGTRTSLYRWHVANDWRMWDTSALASRKTISRLGSPNVAAETISGKSADLKALISMIEQGTANFNIRLLIQYKDGRQIFL